LAREKAVTRRLENHGAQVFCQSLECDSPVHWGPRGPSSATGLIFMLTALFCLPIGALVLIAGLVVFAFERRAVAQADLQSR
jgi:hypothetical protein